MVDTQRRAVIILLVDPDNGMILSASRRNDSTKWGVIGGKIDPGETSIAAAFREYHEETGIELGDYPHLVMAAANEDDGYTSDIYVVRHYSDLERARRAFPDQETVEVESGIRVGFQTYKTLADGPFGNFNMRYLFQALAKANLYES